MNWGNLKSTATVMAHRGDVPWNDFGPLAAARITLSLTVQENQALASVTLAAPDSEGRCFGPLPSDYAAMRNVRLGGDTLEPVDIKALPQCVNPGHYAVTGNQLVTQAQGTASIVYTSRILPFVADSDQSVILDHYPSVWLYALLTEAAIYMQDAELQADYFEEQFRGSVTTANGAYLDQAYGPGLMPMPMGGIV